MSHSSSTSTVSDRPVDAAPPFGIASNLVPVRILLQWGEARTGALFLRELHTATGEPESVGGRLNDPELRFAPFSVHGTVELIRLDAVACLEYAGVLPEVERLLATGARRETVVVELMTGEVIRGEIVAHAPPERARLSDVLNGSERFLPMLSDDRTLYVNRDAIATVRSNP